jgi:hypothetical protein
MNALTFEIPAFCPECGCTVGTGVRFVEGTSEVAFEDCVTICHCGAEAEIPDGTYAYIDGVVELLDGNTISRASLDQIASVLKSSRARDVTPERLVAEVEEIEPSLAVFLRRWLGADDPQTFWTIVAILIVILLEFLHD